MDIMQNFEIITKAVSDFFKHAWHILKVFFCIPYFFLGQACEICDEMFGIIVLSGDAVPYVAFARGHTRNAALHSDGFIAFGLIMSDCV